MKAKSATNILDALSLVSAGAARQQAFAQSTLDLSKSFFVTVGLSYSF